MLKKNKAETGIVSEWLAWYVTWLTKDFKGKKSAINEWPYPQ